MKNFIALITFICLGAFGSHSQNRFDIVISEIFADPSPQVGLPASEWIEIKNTSPAAINLQGWRLVDASGQSGPFPAYLLLPDSSVIICTGSGVAALSAFGSVFSVSSFPSLDNDGELLYLRSSANRIIHSVKYLSTWYGNELKKQGGWSLEMIDTRQPCLGKENWKASMDPIGGTPGKKNSVAAILADDRPPVLSRSYTADSVTVRLVFDEQVDSISGASLSNYSISNGNTFVSVSTLAPLFNEVELKTSAALNEGTVYLITAGMVKDCKGNTMANSEVKTGIPSFPGPGGWIINEILFNPRSTGYDYAEFLNNGDQILDLSELFIANRNNSGVISSIEPLSDEPFLVFPGEYIVVTEDAGNLAMQYLVSSPSKVKTMISLPSFPDDEGVILTLDSRGIVTDEVNYHKNWHFKLITNPEGVSLERIDAGGNSQDKMNWHSASSTAGYGTPGYKNSQYLSADRTGSGFHLEPGIFSPDNDGRDDFLFIRYETASPGYMANLTIFNAAGHMVRQLVRNELTGNRGQWKWDGLDNKGMKLPVGIYIVYAELFNLDGKKEIFKQAVVIAVP